MKYVYLVSALACALCVGICDADEPQKNSPAAQTVVINETPESQTGVRHIDTGDSSGGGRARDYGAGENRQMEQWETYDADSGLPDVVPSDASGQLE